jgi:hypothetical protein
VVKATRRKKGRPGRPTRPGIDLEFSTPEGEVVALNPDRMEEVECRTEGAF